MALNKEFSQKYVVSYDINLAVITNPLSFTEWTETVTDQANVNGNQPNAEVQ